MFRNSRFEVMAPIRDRFANRALTKQEIPQDTLMALVEAASFAPSCFNEQPWRFLLAQGQRWQALFDTLTPLNQEWAKKAPVLMLVCAKKTFAYNDKPNPWHLSDTGTATGLLMTEATHRGLTAHPMAGFDKNAARAAFGLPEDLDIVEVIALGYPGDEDELSEKNRLRNHPQPRKAVEELLL